MSNAEARKAGAILGGIGAFEGAFVLLLGFPNPIRFATSLGFLPGRHTATWVGWMAAAILTVAFVGVSARTLPSVRSNLLRVSWLKLFAFGVAVSAGILEEVSFRGLLMDWAGEHSMPPLIQVLVSGFAFGALHGIWGLFGGSWRAALGATVATGALGAALACVYLAGGRSLAPCIASHFALNLLAEPGLVLAALRGEMGRKR